METLETRLIVHDDGAIRGDPLELEFALWVAPLDVVHEVPLLTIGSVTINAMKLFDAIMNLPVSLQCVGSTEQFSTNIAGEISLSVVESVNMVLKRDIGSVFFPANITGVLSLNVGFGVDLHVSP